jgi:hypothetical protein
MTDRPQTDTLAPDALDSIAAVVPLAPAAWMNTAWMNNMTEMGSAIAAFVAERIKEDVQVPHALLHCKSLAEVQHVQAEFLQKAVAQYQAETGKLIEMTGKMAADLHVRDGADT